MRTLLRTNDPVLISYAEAMLKGEGLEPLVWDTNMSIADGSLGVLPRRLVVKSEDYNRARAIMLDLNLGHELAEDG